MLKEKQKSVNWSYSLAVRNFQIKEKHVRNCKCILVEELPQTLIASRVFYKCEIDQEMFSCYEYQTA